MTDWKRICPLEDIPRLGSRVVRRPGASDIAIFRNADDEVFALDAPTGREIWHCGASGRWPAKSMSTSPHRTPPASSRTPMRGHQRTLKCCLPGPRIVTLAGG